MSLYPRPAVKVCQCPRMSSKKSAVTKWIPPRVRSLHAYVPGEQPKVSGLIKLNTNENPYPPAPKVLAATRAAVDGRFRLYPNPTSQPLREKLARLHQVEPANVIVGNGSDELLALAIRTFVEPAAPGTGSKSIVQFPWPCYSLYPVLTEIHGAVAHPVPLRADFDLPTVAELRRGRQWDFRAALTLITTPNAPSGRGYTLAQLDALCSTQRGLVILDEAYVDFAESDALELVRQHPHVLISRTFSKAYSLCFQRVGYFVGHPELIGALDKVRDSYNVNGLGQIAALATLDQLPYYRKNFGRIKATRERVRRELTGLGWRVLPSATNFLLTEPAGPPARTWLEALRAEKIIVRWFRAPDVNAYLRITIGSDDEMNRFLRAVRKIGRAE